MTVRQSPLRQLNKTWLWFNCNCTSEPRLKCIYVAKLADEYMHTVLRVRLMTSLGLEDHQHWQHFLKTGTQMEWRSIHKKNSHCTFGDVLITAGGDWGPSRVLRSHLPETMGCLCYGGIQETFLWTGSNICLFANVFSIALSMTLFEDWDKDGHKFLQQLKKTKAQPKS